MRSNKNKSICLLYLSNIQWFFWHLFQKEAILLTTRKALNTADLEKYRFTIFIDSIRQKPFHNWLLLNQLKYGQKNKMGHHSLDFSGSVRYPHQTKLSEKHDQTKLLSLSAFQ
jgi:hypothetical protein